MIEVGSESGEGHTATTTKNSCSLKNQNQSLYNKTHLASLMSYEDTTKAKSSRSESTNKAS